MQPTPSTDQVITVPVPQEFIAHYTTPDALSRWGEHRMHLSAGDYDLGEWVLESLTAFEGPKMTHYAVLRKVDAGPDEVVSALWLAHQDCDDRCVARRFAAGIIATY
jgi:hypothetical protein